MKPKRISKKKEIALKVSELRLINTALENRVFKEVIYEMSKAFGYQKTYKELLAKIKKEIKRREGI